MKLDELVMLIEEECELHDRIEPELQKWVTPDEHGNTPLKMAITAFGAGSLRKSAKALYVSPTYLSRLCNGQGKMTRMMATKLHEKFGTGATQREGFDPDAAPV